MGPRQDLPCANPRLVHRDAVDDGVRPGKVDVLEDAVGLLRPSTVLAPRGDAVLPKDEDLPGFDVADELRPNSPERTTLRCNDVGPVRGHAIADGAEAMGVTCTDKLLGGHEHERVGTF